MWGTSDGWARSGGNATHACSPGWVIGRSSIILRTTPTVTRISDQKIKDLKCKAKRARHLSHTQRYEEDAPYRAACNMHGYPKWLMWSDGAWAPYDGSDNRVWRV